jgi:hypothetical protein
LVVANERRSRAERFSVQSRQRLVEPFAHTLGRAGMLRLQALGEIEKQPLGGLHVGTQVRASQNGLCPRSLPVVEVLEDVAHFVDLTPLHERRVAESGAHRLAQGFRAIEDDQQAAIGAQTATLEIRQQALAHGGVFGRAVPESERVFLAVGGDAEGDDEAVIAEVHAVDRQADLVETVERRDFAMPRAAPSCGRRSGDSRRPYSSLDSSSPDRSVGEGRTH